MSKQERRGRRRLTRRQRRRRQQATAPSCSSNSGFSSATLADPDWVVEHDGGSGVESHEFACSDGEFLVAAEPSVVDHVYAVRRDTYSVKLIQSIR